MTRVSALDPELLDATPRGSMTPARRARVIAAHGGQCARCDVFEGLEIDHIVPLWQSGSDDDANLEPLCAKHHKLKTARDAMERAKVKRITAKHNGTAPPPTAKIRSRGFTKRWSNHD